MEAKLNPGFDDHRTIGRELDLFFFDKRVGPGLVCLRPGGGLIRHLLEEIWTKKHLEAGYDLVYSPHVAKLDLWQQSGHWDHFSSQIFPPMQISGSTYLLRPTNCVLHIANFQARQHSYRDLPVRLAELGTVYRNGPSHKGLLRLRGFTQDDAHLFCAPEQVQNEIVGVLELALYFVKIYGLALSRIIVRTQQPQPLDANSIETWNQVAGWIEGALRETRQLDKYSIERGTGVFYAPCLNIMVKDAREREWDLAGLQVDPNLPKRFNITYIARDGKLRPVVVIHRTVIGSIERLMAMLLEQNGGALPVWLSPVQLAVLPCADRHLDYSWQIIAALKKAGLRAQMAMPDNTISYRVREMQRSKVPFILVVGDHEMAQQTISVRERDGQLLRSMRIGELVALVQAKTNQELAA